MSGGAPARNAPRQPRAVGRIADLHRLDGTDRRRSGSPGSPGTPGISALR